MINLLDYMTKSTISNQIQLVVIYRQATPEEMSQQLTNYYEIKIFDQGIQINKFKKMLNKNPKATSKSKDTADEFIENTEF